MPLSVIPWPVCLVLLLRMRSRDPRTQMPPLGTAAPDADGIRLIERWIADAAQARDRSRGSATASTPDDSIHP